MLVLALADHLVCVKSRFVRHSYMSMRVHAFMQLEALVRGIVQTQAFIKLTDHVHVPEKQKQ